MIEVKDDYEELIKVFHFTWGSFPGAVRLIDKKNMTLAVNETAKRMGWETGIICYKVGTPESHKGCRKTIALNNMQPQIDRPLENKIRGWIPIEGYPDVVVHFSLDLPEVNS